ncbi:unnamed protein product [Sympodiomycopsis kandeliae]
MEAAQWGQTPSSPSSGSYAPSNPSSRHPSQTSLPQPTFTSQNDLLASFEAYPPVFESEHIPSSNQNHQQQQQQQRQVQGRVQQQQQQQQQHQSANQIGGFHTPWSVGSVAMGSESWYDPERVDTYTTHETLMSPQDPQLNTQQQSYPAQEPQQSQLQYNGTEQRVFRDHQGYEPSPFASPATSHHRTSSFGSDFGSPAPLQQVPLFHNASQQSLPDGTNVHGWPQPAAEMGNLGGIQDMSLADKLSPALSPFSNSQSGLHGHPNDSTSSLHSQSSYHTGFEQNASQQSLTDQEVQQLIAQHSGQPSFSQSPQPPFQQPIVPNVSVHDASTSDLSFEQVLQQHLNLQGQTGDQAVQQLFPQQQASDSNGGHWSSETQTTASPWSQDPNFLSAGHANPQASSTQACQSSSGSGLERPIPTIAPVRQPTREDSFDKLKKFLKLDVNMSYVGPQDDSPTTSGMRKRSASDAGPGLLGNTGGFQNGLQTIPPKTNTEALSKYSTLSGQNDLPEYESLDTSGISMPLTLNAPSAAGQHSISDQGQSSTPVLLSRPSSGGGVGPMRNTQSATLARESMTGTPYPQSRPWNVSRRSGGSAASIDFSNDSSDTGNEASSWGFPPRDGKEAGPQRLRRPGFPGHGGGHKRAAQSEDLSSLAYIHDDNDFLRTITAPDGSLAPPGAAAYARPSRNNRSPALRSPGGNINVQQQHYQPIRNRHQSVGSTYTSTDSSALSLGYSPSAFQTSPQNSGLAPTTYASLQAGSPAIASNQSSPLSSSSGHVSSQPVNDCQNGTGAAINRASSRGGSPSGYHQTALPTYTSMNRRRANGTDSSSSPTSLSQTFANPAVQNVTTVATQAASASRRKNDANFVCPIPGCGSHFTRQFNLRSHLRSHADERPFKCAAPGCNKAFARAHDAKRHHETLHLSMKKYVCDYCGRQFARLDALHRHLKPDSGLCAEKAAQAAASGDVSASSAGMLAEASSSIESFTSASDDFKPDTVDKISSNAQAARGQTFAGHVL